MLSFVYVNFFSIDDCIFLTIRAVMVTRDILARLVAYRLNYNPLGNFIICSDPRGGSTWLTELLEPLLAVPVLWEPLHIEKVPEFKRLNFSWRQHIAEDQVWEDANLAFERLFKGKLLNDWITSQTSFYKLLVSDRALIKFCRANALLPWMTRNFNFRYKPIYLIRHPFAVVSSQLKQGGWDYEFTGFVIPDSPFNKLYLEHSKFLKSLRTKEEALTALWCISNQVSLCSDRNNNSWITINYECLVDDTQATLERVFREWGMQIEVSKLNFAKASKTTVGSSPLSGSAQIEYWRKGLNSDQVKRMTDVLQYFHVSVYSSNPYPEIIFT